MLQLPACPCHALSSWGRLWSCAHFQLSPLSRSVIHICSIWVSCSTTWLTPILTMQFAFWFRFSTIHNLMNLAPAHCGNGYACRFSSFWVMKSWKRFTQAEKLPEKSIRHNSGLDMVQSWFILTIVLLSIPAQPCSLRLLNMARWLTWTHTYFSKFYFLVSPEYAFVWSLRSHISHVVNMVNTQIVYSRSFVSADRSFQTYALSSRKFECKSEETQKTGW